MTTATYRREGANPIYNRICQRAFPTSIKTFRIQDFSPTQLLRRLSSHFAAPTAAIKQMITGAAAECSSGRYRQLKGRGDFSVPQDSGLDFVRQKRNVELLEASETASTVFATRAPEMAGLGTCNCRPMRFTATAPTRHAFDELVNQQMDRIFDEQQELVVTMVATGDLFGEMGDIASWLLKRGPSLKGKLIIQIVDHEYQPYLRNEKTPYSKAIQDFWHNLCHATGKDMKLELNVFSSLKDYVASDRPHADVMLGIDLSSGSDTFLKMAPFTMQPNGFGAALLKVGNSEMDAHPECRFFEGRGWNSFIPEMTAQGVVFHAKNPPTQQVQTATVPAPYVGFQNQTTMFGNYYEPQAYNYYDMPYTPYQPMRHSDRLMGHMPMQQGFNYPYPAWQPKIISQPF